MAVLLLGVKEYIRVDSPRLAAKLPK